MQDVGGVVCWGLVVEDGAGGFEELWGLLGWVMGRGRRAYVACDLLG